MRVRMRGERGAGIGPGARVAGGRLCLQRAGACALLGGAACAGVSCCCRCRGSGDCGSGTVACTPWRERGSWWVWRGRGCRCGRLGEAEGVVVGVPLGAEVGEAKEGVG